MSSVSVPDPGEKIRLGARIIVAPTATRAAATIAKIEVDAWAFSRITARPYSRYPRQSRGCVDVVHGGGATKLGKTPHVVSPAPVQSTYLPNPHGLPLIAVTTNQEATMIALRPSFFAAAAVSLPLAMGTPTAHAGPALSELSDVADYNQDACAQRAQASFSNDGWQGVSPNGYTVMADRGPLSGVIVCMYQSLTQSVPVIVVAGGNGNAASNEAAALKSQML